MNALEKKCLRSLVGVSRTDRVRNEEVRIHTRAGIERELASRADQRVLRWFGLVERMNEYRMARRVLMAEVSAWRASTRETEVRLECGSKPVGRDPKWGRDTIFMGSPIHFERNMKIL